MTRKPRHEMNAWWRRRTIVIPPETRDEWVRLVAWELWMGMTIFLLTVVGLWLVTTAPERLVAVRDLSPCWADPPAPPPCARTLYRGGMHLMFSGFTGLVMWVVSMCLLWHLWSVAEPPPIDDDFLRLLDNSFSRDWRNPLTWPWSRVLWAYGFTAIGSALTAGVALGVLSLVIRQ